METKMPFREKIAWIALLSILGASAVYFGLLAAHHGRPDHGFFIGLFLKIVVIQVIVTIAASILVSIFSRRDAGLPRDERDKQIERTAASQAYFPMLIAVIFASASIHLGNDLFGMLNTLLAVIMASEALRFALQIAAYRRES
jgi:uncharacterized membrane protein